MLTSFFSKSKPINFLLLSIALLLVYVLGVWVPTNTITNLFAIAGHLLYLGLSVFMIFLLDFIVKKNDLTKQNTYAIFSFVGFIGFLPSSLSVSGIIFSNVFALLAYRRIFSLYSERNTEKKILDASLYISLAAFFHFYAVLLFVVLFLGIVRKKYTTVKHMLIPIAGFGAMFLLVTVFFFLTEDSFAWFFKWRPKGALDFTAYNSMRIVVPLAILGALIIWTTAHRLVKMASISKKDRPNYLLLIITLVVTIVIVFLSPEKQGAEILFIFFPLAIIVANFIEQTTEFWFRELLLWLVFVTPFITLFL